MKLIWKILREHLSIGQLISFLVANIVGLSIIMLGIQLYVDVIPIFTSNTDFLKPEYVVISKPVTTVDTFQKDKPSFSKEELENLQAQPFVSRLGLFRAAQYNVTGSIRLGDFDVTTDMFFESVPDCFVDVKTDQWHFSPEDDIVPIVIPRDYLAVYNFGFASGNDMVPAVSEKLVSSITMDLTLYNYYDQISIVGQVVGLSNRLNTILVPESFIQWTNSVLAMDTTSWQPSRIILQVDNPADAKVAAYMQEHDYVVANDKLDSSKATWFLHLMISIVMVIGLIICVLACFILVLSIFLLLQKNTKQMRDLVLLGYAHSLIARPYLWIVGIVNVLALMAAAVVTYIARCVYLPHLQAMSNEFVPASASYPLVITGGFMLGIVVVSAILIVRRIRRI